MTEEYQGIYSNFYEYLEKHEQLVVKGIRFDGFSIMKDSKMKASKIKVDIFYNDKKCGYFFKNPNEEAWNYVNINIHGEFEIRRNIF